MKHFVKITAAVVLSMLLGACSAAPASSPAQSEASVGSSASPVSSGEPASSGAVERTLVIGSGANTKEYAVTFETEPTPDQLIAAIAEKTGWNLSLAEPVSAGKDGMTVVFSNDSAILTGPPDPQNEEFRVYDPGDLIFHILDSVRLTLQKNSVDPSLGDPSALDVYFALEGDQPLSLPEHGVDLPLDSPYPGSENLTPAQ